MDWKFYRGKLVGAENPNFDDKAWRNVTIPHDWSIEDLPATNVSDKMHNMGPVPSEKSLKVLDGYFKWWRTPEGEAWAK